MGARLCHLLSLACVGAACAPLGAAEPLDAAHNVQQGYLRDGVLYVTAPPPKGKDTYIRLCQANLLPSKESRDGEKVRTFRDWLTLDNRLSTLRWRLAPDGI